MSANHHDLEEGEVLSLDFSKSKSISSISEDVIPVAVQDKNSKEILILAYANQKALDYTIKNSVAAFWSTSRNELWIKGKTSGDYLDVHEIRVNCEQNSLLYIVTARSTGACHTKNASGKTRRSCYYRRIQNNNKLIFLEK